MITHILNVSLVSQQVPKIWKTANVRPIPKETNVSALDQLRPISVTDITVRLFNPRFRIEETGFLLYSFRSVCL